MQILAVLDISFIFFKVFINGRASLSFMKEGFLVLAQVNKLCN